MAFPYGPQGRAGAPRTPPSRPKSAPKSPLRGILAGLIVIVTASVAIYFALGGKEEKVQIATIQTKKSHILKNVNTTNNIHKAIPKTNDVSSPVNLTHNLGYYTNKIGQIKSRTGKKFVIEMGTQKQLFNNAAEDQLSGIVNTPLGSNYYDYDVPEDFEEVFVHSLTNKIIITGDDSPDDIEKKQRVIEAKENLRKVWESGADIREFMLKEKQTMKKKFEEYLFFEQGLNELRANDASNEEIAEYALAAKKMMQQQGVEEALGLGFEEEEAVAKLDALINSPKNGDDNSEENKNE